MSNSPHGHIGRLRFLYQIECEQMHENVKIWKLYNIFGVKGRPTSNEKNDLRKLYILDRYCFEWGMSKGRNELNQKEAKTILLEF